MTRTSTVPQYDLIPMAGNGRTVTITALDSVTGIPIAGATVEVNDLGGEVVATGVTGMPGRLSRTASIRQLYCQHHSRDFLEG